MSEYNLICRICLLQTKNLKRIDCKMFRYCIGIDISKSSSSSVCEDCNKCLNDSFTFRKKCIDAYFNIQMREYKIEVLTDDIPDNIIETCVKEEVLPDPPDLIQCSFEEEFEDDMMKAVTDAPDLINYSVKQDIKVEEPMPELEWDDIKENIQKTEPMPELEWDDIKANIQDEGESETDYFLSEEETFMQQILKVRKNKPHEKPVSNIRDFHLCYICGVSRSVRSSFHAHLKTHAVDPKGKNRIPCDQCDKTYKSKDHLNTHKRVHHKNIRAFSCTQCDKTFTYWSSRKFHMVAAHGLEPRWSCLICTYKTQNSTRFKDHMNQHTGELPFECDVCKKKFLSNRQLKAHEIVHTRTRDQICSYCNKAFGTLKSLKSHIKIHTQERNYVCPVESCGKDFIQNHVLKSHMKANHPEVEIPPPGTIVSKKSKNLYGTIQRNSYDYRGSDSD